MPGAQYYDDYSLDQEPSAADIPHHFHPQKALPNSRNVGQQPEDRPAPVLPVQTHGEPQGVMLASPLASPIVLNGHESGLPPTPPTNSHEHQQNASFSPPAFADGVMSSLLPRKSTASTPINQRSPPTPDDTPPASLVSPPQRNRSGLSSRAESFRTAREEQPFSDNEDDRMVFGLDGVVDGRPGQRLRYSMRSPVALADAQYLNGMRPRTMQKTDVGLGREDVDTEEDDGPTPTQDRSRNRLKEVMPDDAGDPTEYIPNREWDTNLMRNVTIRPKRKHRQSSSVDSPAGNPKATQIPDTDAGAASSSNNGDQAPLPDTETTTVSTPPRRKEQESYGREGAIAPSPVRHPSRDLQLGNHRPADSQASPQSPSSEHSSARDPLWPTPIRNISSQYRSPSDSRRISSLSNTSAVVEAIIITTPPKQRRPLRHVSKNMSLRSGAGPLVDNPFGTSPTSPTGRASFDSDEYPRRSLHRKRGSIGERHRDSHGPEFSPVDASPPYRGNDQQEPRRQTLPPVSEADNSAARLSRAPMKQSARDGPDWTRPPPALRQHRRLSSAPAKVQFSEPKGVSFKDEDVQAEGPSTTLTRSLTQRALAKAIPTMSSGEAERVLSFENERTLARDRKKRAISDSVSEHRQEDIRAPSNKSKVVSAATEREGVKNALDAFSNTAEPLRVSKVVTTVSQDVYLKPELERLPTNESLDSRRSFDRSTVGTHENRRMSLDRSTIRTEEHANARHLYAQTTPFSQISDTPAELNEARAVSIYPHNNHSILVVQQGLRPLSARRLTVTSTSSQEQPTITVEPSTPPQEPSETFGVDSPLRNPRKAPPLPAINILPATPAEEVDSPLDTQQPRGPEPAQQLVRRPTLAQRARRFSDTFVQPFIARTTSIRRTYRGVSKRPVTSSGDRPDRDANLHPFWHPRGFWDDVSDSDSEFGDAYEERYRDGEEGAARLPPGGDTSDVVDEEPALPRLSPLGIGAAARLLPGLRRGDSKKFMLGNSLGFERHGTNKRKPQITLHRTASGRIVRAADTSINSGTAASATTSSGSGPAAEGEKTTGRRRVWHGPRGLQVHWLGVSGLREMVEERMREKRRDRIRKSIGPRFVVDGAPMTSSGGN